MHKERKKEIFVLDKNVCKIEKKNSLGKTSQKCKYKQTMYAIPEPLDIK